MKTHELKPGDVVTHPAFAFPVRIDRAAPVRGLPGTFEVGLTMAHPCGVSYWPGARFTATDDRFERTGPTSDPRLIPGAP